MIDKIYIESAKNIRFKFLNLNNRLSIYQKNLADLFIYLENVVKELETINEKEVSKIRTKADASVVTEHIVKKLSEIETEEQKLIRLITPINNEIDKLKYEENFLYSQIKEKYHSLTDEQIKKEIQSHLEK